MKSAEEILLSDPTLLNRHDTNVAPSDTTISPGGSILLLLSAIGSLVVYSTRKKDSKAIWTQPDASSDIPCYKCQFFDNNPYLKCTVRPSVVLSQQAVDCGDYCSRQSQKH